MFSDTKVQPTPNTQPPCNGLFAPGAPLAGYPTYPGLGTNYTAGNTTPLAAGSSPPRCLAFGCTITSRVHAH